MTTCNPVSGCGGSGTINTGQEVCKLEDLFPYMMPELPSCPPSLLLQNLRMSAREFCIDTEAWREVLEPINIREGVRTYEMDIDYCAKIKRIKRVEYKTQDQIDYNPNQRGSFLRPYEYDIKTPYDFILRFDPLEDVRKGLIIDVILYPTFDSDSIPVEFMNEWFEGIVGGAKYLLMKQKNKRWSNPEEANFYRYEYRKFKNRAVQEILRQHKDADLGFSA